MQTTGDPLIDDAVEAAVNSNQRAVYADIWVDWTGDGVFGDHPLDRLTAGLKRGGVDNIQLDRALAGAAPEELMLVEGASAAELSFELSGDYLHAATNTRMPYTAVFSPYNGLSPLYGLNPIGAEILYYIGIETGAYGVIWYQQFVGNVRTIQVDRGSGVVTITALDRVEKLRVPVQLPPWGTSPLHARRGWAEGQLMYSSWVIDHALRFADCSTTPLRPITFEERGNPTLPDVNGNLDWGLQLWVTGNGSYAPTIGTVDGVDIQGFPKTEAGAPDLTNRYGQPHPLVADEAIASGKRPRNLHSMGTDDSGLRQASPGPGEWPLWTGNTDGLDRQRSFFKQYWARDRSALAVQNANLFGFTLITNGPNGDYYLDDTDPDGFYPMSIFLMFSDTDPVAYMQARLQIFDGQVRLVLETPGATTAKSFSPWAAIPAGQDTVSIEAKVQPLVGLPSRAALRVNGVQTWSTEAWPAYDGPQNWEEHRGLVRIDHHQGLQDIFWAARYITLAASMEGTVDGLNQLERFAYREAKYGAVLDDGLNRLTHIPQAEYEDAWSLVAEVAAAEFGSVFWDEHGVFRFWNRETMLAKQAEPVKTINLDHPESLSITNSLDSVRNIIVTEASKGDVTLDVLFEAEDPDSFFLPDNQWSEFVLSGEHVIRADPHTLPQYATSAGAHGLPVWSDSVKRGFVMQVETSPGVWVESTAILEPEFCPAVVMDANRNMILRAFNFSLGTDNWRIAKVRIDGQKLASVTPVVETLTDADSINTYGPRNYHLSGDWVQYQPDVVKTLKEWVLERTAKPIPMTDGISTVGDPRVQLGDCVVLNDPDGFGEEMTLQIYGIRRTFSKDEGLTDELTVEMIEPAGIGKWDSEQYGRWDTTFTWSD